MSIFLTRRPESIFFFLLKNELESPLTIQTTRVPIFLKNKNNSILLIFAHHFCSPFFFFSRKKQQQDKLTQSTTLKKMDEDLELIDESLEDNGAHEDNSGRALGISKATRGDALFCYPAHFFATSFPPGEGCCISTSYTSLYERYA